MGKISLSNIADELATKSGITHEAADTFVHSFIGTIEKGLKEDGMVKVKGLGTFKLMEVSDRGSVDVNTGERIVIKGYRKIAFTPDSAMKELVNRPFAHFEPIELNEGFPAEEELETLDNVADDNDDVKTIEEVVEPIAEEPIVECSVAEEPIVAELVTDQSSVNEPIDETPTAEDPVMVDSTTEEPIVEEPLAEESMQEAPVTEESVVDSVVEGPAAEEMVTEEPVVETVPIAAKQKGKKCRRGGCLWGLLLLIIAASALVYGYLTLEKTAYDESVEDLGAIKVKSNLEEELGEEWGDEPVVEEAQPVKDKTVEVANKNEVIEQKEKQEHAVVEIPKMPSVETVKPVADAKYCAVTITESLQSKSIKDITPADTTDYFMDGTLLTHSLKSGETIISLAKKYYGDKRLWPYIVKYNNMKDFNKVAIGQKINMPVLKEKAIE